ncbi:hypothetical protein [Rhizobium sp. 768_B6_N1_8]
MNNLLAGRLALRIAQIGKLVARMHARSVVVQALVSARLLDEHLSRSGLR